LSYDLAAYKKSAQKKRQRVYWDVLYVLTIWCVCVCVCVCVIWYRVSLSHYLINFAHLFCRCDSRYTVPYLIPMFNGYYNVVFMLTICRCTGVNTLETLQQFDILNRCICLTSVHIIYSKNNYFKLHYNLYA